MRWYEIEDKDEFISKQVMGSTPLKGYTKSLPLALEVVRKTQQKLSDMSLSIKLKSHGVHAVDISLSWWVSVEEKGYAWAEVRSIREECNDEQIPEMICCMLTQALGLVVLESEEDE